MPPGAARGSMQNDSQGPSRTTVDRFFHPTDAHIAAGKLESEGIPVFLLGINHASANWLLSNALGGIRLQVPASQVSQARQLLAQIENPTDEPKMKCPQCGGTDTTAMSNSRKIAFLAVANESASLPVLWHGMGDHKDRLVPAYAR